MPLYVDPVESYHGSHCPLPFQGVFLFFVVLFFTISKYMQYSLQLFQVSFSICRDTEGVECLLMNFGSKDFTSVRMFKYLALHFEVFTVLGNYFNDLLFPQFWISKRPSGRKGGSLLCAVWRDLIQTLGRRRREAWFNVRTLSAETWPPLIPQPGSGRLAGLLPPKAGWTLTSRGEAGRVVPKLASNLTDNPEV